ncbi:MAG: hypothetical protein AAFZ52_07265, partial [Bacteroidota bacterium]
EFRIVDVLDEVAFLYLDLEALGYQELADQLAAAYQRYNRSILGAEDRLIFDYYKCYRANVRLKVIAIKIDSLAEEANAGDLLDQLLRYHALFRKYAERIWPTRPSDTPSAVEAPSPFLSHQPN